MTDIFKRDRYSNKADVFIDGPIGGPDGITGEQFKKELSALDSDCELQIFFNSSGGSVADGKEIYKCIRGHSGPTTAHIQGPALSIASVIAVGCDSVLMSSNSLLMIHNPFWGVGDAESMCSTGGQKLITIPRQFKKQKLITIPTAKTSPRAKIAQMKRSVQKHKNSLSERQRLLETDKEFILNAYFLRTGSNKTELAEMMAEETWFTSWDCIQFGFADEITSPTGLISHWDFSQFANPTNFLGAKYMDSAQTARKKRAGKVNRKRISHMQRIIKQRQEETL